MLSELVELPGSGGSAKQKALDDARMLISTLSTVQAQGQVITASDVIDLSQGNPHPVAIAWIKANTQITVADIKKAQWARKVRDELECVPQHPGELVDAYVRIHGATYKYNGMVGVSPKPFMRNDDGSKTPITPDDIAESSVVEEYVRFHFPDEVNRREFALDIREIDVRLKLGFGPQQIEDAIERWTIAAGKDRRHMLAISISQPLLTWERTQANAQWDSVVAHGFVTGETSPAFVIAVLKKFMWQTKRKLNALPVTNHLMPVITGVQGGGKSTFVRMMIKPLDELSRCLDFKAICEDRNIDIWSSYIMFVDEMGYASKADIDVVKNVITAETLSRRPMGSNGQITITQNATLIGCSNKELEQLIKDPTGIRRFVALRFRDTSQADKDALNRIDWKLLWRSVDHLGDDPMDAHRHALAEAQEASREVGRVEHWLDEFDPDLPHFKLSLHKDTIRASDLYDLFHAFEDRAYPGGFKTSQTEFGSEMKRLNNLGEDKQVFVWKRTKKANVYQYNARFLA